MAAPRVNISVDPDTGVWTTDGMPMLYVPRHFLMGLLASVREALGEEAAQRQFYAACHDAAYRWCAMEASQTGLAGMDVFHHYLRRLSERGWGLFDGAGIDGASGTGRVTLRHSAFVASSGPSGGKACGFCAGWAPGALAWVAASQGRNWRLGGRELRCAAEGFAACEFAVEPA
jgi:predicted hydrocarbon binding protein